MTDKRVIDGRAAALHVYGVKCDAPGCGWADMSVRRSDYPAWRNAPCPKCGANVLTDADWRALLLIERLTRWLNILLFWVPGKKIPQPGFRFNMDGTGVKSIERIPSEDLP